MLVPAQKCNISSIRSRITIASEGGGDLVYEFMLGVSRPEIGDNILQYPA